MAIAGQCLHSIKTVSPTFLPPKASRLGVGRRLGKDIAGTADLNSPNGYSIPYDVMLSNKTWG